MTQFYGKTKVCYGENALETLERLPAKRAFLVTEPFMVKAGFANRIISHLERGAIGCRVFDQVEPDPSLELVIRGTVSFLREQCDMVIALGGGSAIDAAKAIAFFACKAGGQAFRPMVAAVPTTSGTGAEVTSISVITDTANGVKIPIDDEMLIPDVAILDARFTRTLPAPVTAATGMDVLTHAIESYTSRQANIFTSIYAENAIRHVFTYLHRAYCRMDDMRAREMLLLGSCMAGMAFNNSGLGITHSMAHSLGGLFHIPHGLANALLLPHVIRFNSFDVGTKYREIAEMAALPATSVEEGTNSLIGAVRDLNASLGIAGKIRELGVDEALFKKHLPIMAENALNDICTAGNPRQPSRGDIQIILEQAW